MALGGMELKLLIESLSYVLFAIACTVGLSWQVYELSSGFFAFDVLTSVSIEVKQNGPIPALNVIFYSHELFDIGEFNRGTGSNLSAISVENIEDRFKFMSELHEIATVDQIMKYTPSVEVL